MSWTLGVHARGATTPADQARAAAESGREEESLFRTEDPGRRAEGDYLAITGRRKKNLIIRNGESIGPETAARLRRPSRPGSALQATSSGGAGWRSLILEADAEAVSSARSSASETSRRAIAVDLVKAVRSAVTMASATSQRPDG